MRTICALGTACGSSGINIIRISGDDALSVLRGVFSPLEKGGLKPRMMTLGKLLDDSGSVIDKCLGVWFRSPASYTGEDVCELHIHGGAALARLAMRSVMAHGALPAEPGEFTKRAFLNGKLDMAEAESIQQLISAKSESGARAAANALSGAMTAKIREAQEQLKDVIALLEAGIEYPEEDIEAADDAREPLRAAEISINGLLDGLRLGKLARDGLRIAIAGRPNVGKSSLLNAILGNDRAIVTQIPGTTRDVIEEQYQIEGIPFVFIDTAGIRDTEDAVETIGVERSRRAVNEADMTLFVLDGTAPLTDEECELFETVRKRDHIIVLNKCDDPSFRRDNGLTKRPFMLSAKTGVGVEELLHEILKRALGGDHMREEIFVWTERQADALRRAGRSMTAARTALDEGIDLDCVTIDLMDAYRALGEITGETLTEDIVDRIFSKFCLGK